MRNDGPDGRQANYELVAWCLFLGSAIFFILVAVRERDMLSIMAAVLFLAGCLVFLAGQRT